MLTLLVYLLIFCAVAYLVWWAIGAMALPQPVRVVAIVLMAIIGIVFLLQLVGGAGPMPHLSLR